MPSSLDLLRQLYRKYKVNPENRVFNDEDSRAAAIRTVDEVELLKTHEAIATTDGDADLAKRMNQEEIARANATDGDEDIGKKIGPGGIC